MPPPVVRADYEQLDRIAKLFGREAQAIREMARNLTRRLAALEHGDWRGKGADAFFAEMRSGVLPAIKRLEAALDRGQSVTARISSLIKQAEQDAALFFKIQMAASLGRLSQTYETGGKGPGTVSSGKGDPGGVSYGSYQLTSKNGGRVAQFLKSEGKAWADEFKGLKPGSDEFTKKWKEIAARDPDGFALAQHDFIARTHYIPAVDALGKGGFDVSKHSEALREVIWSTAVQHGPNTSIVRDALDQLASKKDVTDKQIIEAIYAERGRKDANGVLVHFPKSSEKVRTSVENRFKSEMEDALKLLEAEQGMK